MIDREQVISWARDANIRYEYGEWTATTEEIEALITRAMNEAYELAAKKCVEELDCHIPVSMWGTRESLSNCIQAIRKLKTGVDK